MNGDVLCGPEWMVSGLSIIIIYDCILAELRSILFKISIWPQATIDGFYAKKQVGVRITSGKIVFPWERIFCWTGTREGERNNTEHEAIARSNKRICEFILVLIEEYKHSTGDAQMQCSSMRCLIPRPHLQQNSVRKHKNIAGIIRLYIVLH